MWVTLNSKEISHWSPCSDSPRSCCCRLFPLPFFFFTFFLLLFQLCKMWFYFFSGKKIRIKTMGNGCW